MNWRTALAFVWPILAMLIWTGYEWRKANIGLEIQLDIGGYDPRDLLAGHFVRYQVDYHNDKLCRVFNELPEGELCLCLSLDPKHNTYRGEAILNCQVAAGLSTCKVHLRGVCQAARFIADIERFYIPENISPELQVLPANSKIVVNIGKSGLGAVKELLPAGKPLEQYIAEQRNKRDSE